MGVAIRLVAFLVGALGLVFVGLNGANDWFGVDTSGLLAKMGETPASIANMMSAHVGAGLDMLGAQLAKVGGGEVDPEKPTALVKYGPEAIGALVSAMMVMFSTRR
jgi:hypothetical protein